jgi:CBS domain-containing protein
MRVHDVMTQPVCTMRDTDAVEQAAALLTTRKITAAPVLDETGALIGMVSEGDLLWRRVPADPGAHSVRLDPASLRRPKTVGEVMSAKPLTTEPDADIADVAHAMVYHDVRSMPVLDGGKIVGIISRRDILQTVIRGDEVLAAEIQHRLDEYGGGTRHWRVTVAGSAATVQGGFDDDAERLTVRVLARTVPGVVAVELLDADAVAQR